MTEIKEFLELFSSVKSNNDMNAIKELEQILDLTPNDDEIYVVSYNNAS
ncbi:hypothetical protein [Candidatus Nitrosocosmicus sp. SS]|jgi:hypothetical protein|nr:hypothetical protein [Candidatus Nitrosocosmicus sp. SS]